MFKVLITSIYDRSAGVAIHTVIAEFKTPSEADACVKVINELRDIYLLQTAVRIN